MAIHEGDCGLAANKVLKTRCVGVVDAHHHVVVVDQVAVVPLQQHAAVPDHCTCFVFLPTRDVMEMVIQANAVHVVFIDGVLDVCQKLVHDTGLEFPVCYPIFE